MIYVVVYAFSRIEEVAQRGICATGLNNYNTDDEQRADKPPTDPIGLHG